MKRLQVGHKTIFFILVVIWFFTCSFEAPAQNKIHNIILMETVSVPVVLNHSKWFAHHLKEKFLNRKDNINLTILKLNGDRDYGEKLLRDELKRGRPDLVVTNATMASQIAQKNLRGSGIPQVFMTVSDPVGAGLINQIGAPSLSNITGRVHMISRETRVEMAMNLIYESGLATPVKVGFIHSTYPSAVGDIRMLMDTAEKRNDIEFIPYAIEYRKMPEGKEQMLTEAIEAVKSLRDKVDFWWEPSGPLGELVEFTEILLKNSQQPIIMGTKVASVEAGALMHLTPDAEGTGEEIAMLAFEILTGKDPGTIPVHVPEKFNIGVNLTTALKHNIIIPHDILSLAKNQVYR